MQTRRNRRRTRKRGGKVLGEGHAAKTYDPPIQCKDGRNMSGYVTRVVKDGDRDELLTTWNPEIIERLKKIDPDQKYFYYPQYCEPGELTDENRADGITDESKQVSEYVKKGYGTIGPRAFERRNWVEYFLGRKNWINKNQKFQGMMDHLVEAVELLHKNKIAHGDIWGDNIIIAQDNLPRIIDFGEATINPPKWRLNSELKYVKRLASGYTPTSVN